MAQWQRGLLPSLKTGVLASWIHMVEGEKRTPTDSLLRMCALHAHHAPPLNKNNKNSLKTFWHGKTY